MTAPRFYYETNQLRTHHKQQLQLLQALTGFDVWAIVDCSSLRSWKLVPDLASATEYVCPSLCNNDGTPISFFVQASNMSAPDLGLVMLEAQTFEDRLNPESRKTYIPMTGLSTARPPREMLEHLMLVLLADEGHAHVREMVSMLDLPDLQRWFVETLQNT